MTSARLGRVAVAVALLGAVAGPAAAQTLDAVADTFVNSDSPTMNFGGLSFAEVGVLGLPKNAVERALLAFDLSGIPAGTPIARARLRVVLTDAAPDPPDFAATVALLASGFDESTVTWDTQPAVLPAPTAMAVVTEAIGDVLTLDVTQLVRAQRAGAMPGSIALRLAASDETPAFLDRYLDFASRESGAAPMLLIDGEAHPAPAMSGATWALALLALAAVGAAALAKRRGREPAWRVRWGHRSAGAR